MFPDRYLDGSCVLGGRQASAARAAREMELARSEFKAAGCRTHLLSLERNVLCLLDLRLVALHLVALQLLRYNT